VTTMNKFMKWLKEYCKTPRKLDIQFVDNFWFSIGVHIDQWNPSITLHLPLIVICIGWLPYPGYQYSLRRMLTGQEWPEYRTNETHVAEYVECDKCGHMQEYLQ
jgi:hypothetical protein